MGKIGKSGRSAGAVRRAVLVLAAAMLLCPAASPVFAADEETVHQRSTVHQRYMAGFAGGYFKPEKAITRAESAQIAYNLLGAPERGGGSCSYGDVPETEWYAEPVKTLCTLGLFDDGASFRPEEAISRAEFIDLLVRLRTQDEQDKTGDPARVDTMGSALPGTGTKTDSAPQGTGTGSAYRDVRNDHWAAGQIAEASARGWISGYEDATFRPENDLTRAEACAIINRAFGRRGSVKQARRLLGMGIFADVSPAHWAGCDLVEASVSHSVIPGPEHTDAAQQKKSAEEWTEPELLDLTFAPGFHEIDGHLYYAGRGGKLLHDRFFGAFYAAEDGVVTQVGESWQSKNVPYISQLDGLNAWVGCEGIASLMGLQAKGFAGGVEPKVFLDRMPRTGSDPELGFVGSPYKPDKEKKTRTTIFPARLAEYCNGYCRGKTVCADFRGASVSELRRELLAGNSVVAYMTLWWEKPYRRVYMVEGNSRLMVSNNHAVLVCGYDPQKGYYISDPYNYHNRGEIHQYWENSDTFEAIWNDRQMGMVLR